MKNVHVFILSFVHFHFIQLSAYLLNQSAVKNERLLSSHTSVSWDQMLSKLCKVELVSSQHVLQLSSPPFTSILVYSGSWPLYSIYKHINTIYSIYSIAIIYLLRAVNCYCSVISWKQIWVSAGGAAGGALMLPWSNFCLTKAKSSAGFLGGIRFLV